MTRSISVFGWSICWLWLGIAGCVDPRSADPQDTMPAALRAAWIQRVQNDAGPEYAIARARTRGFEARHPRQNLRTRFEHDGVVLTNRDDREPLRMTLARVNGREPGPGTLSHEVNKVTMARPGIDEWYVHGPMGLEQGFTIPTPLSSTGAAEDPLQLEMAVEGDYRPTMRGDAIVWKSGGRTLETRDLYAFDAEGKQLSASMRASDTKLLFEVDVADARYPIVIDPVWSEQQKLVPTADSDYDELGWSVSVSGDTAVIGARSDDDNGNNAGAAYVFVRSGTVWTEQQKLLASDGEASEEFGYSVSVSGDTAVIGAYRDDDNGSFAGSAYVFVRSGTVWNEQQKLLAPDGEADDQLGYSVSVSGDTVVLGARGDDDNGSNAGTAHVFVRSGTVWTQQQKLLASDGVVDDWFGHSVSVSSDTVVLGAWGDDDNGSTSGSAYVFVRSGTGWTEQQKLVASDGAAADRFGWPVSVSGDTAVFGAWGDDDNGDTSGSAYVFVRSGTVWTEQQKLIASDGAGGDRFGASMSVSGDTAVIGAWLDDDNGNMSGSAYVFVRSGTVWTEQQKLLASDGAAGDLLGNSVSVSGDTVVLGAPADIGAASGSAHVFVRSGTVWTEEQRLLASENAVGDDFGHSVSISGDTAVIGARYDDDNGSDAGAAYVFVRSGTVWTEQQKLLASDGEADDRFGVSVSVSGDTAVIGARFDDDNGSNAGAAFVFVRSGAVWTEQQKLLASDGAVSDTFGRSVSVSGDTAVIGAPYDDDNGSATGAAYAFVRSGTVWTEQQKLLASDGAADDQSGWSVSVSGDTAVIGAWGDDDNGSDAGAVYVFVRSGTVWTEQPKLLASDGAAVDRFGNSVSISGDTAVIGAPYDDDNGSNAGAVYVFMRSGTVWTEQPKFLASDGAADDWFGYSVSVSGDTVLVAALGDDDLGTDSGAVYAFLSILQNGEACTMNSECMSGFCDPAGSVCACDEAADCLIGQVCDTSEAPNACEAANSCGNGAVEAGETCDDGNGTSGDGCSAICFVDNLPIGSDCTNGGNAACASGVCDTTETSATCEAANSCANGVVESGELCDDGNGTSGDGCSATCFVEDLPVGSNCTDGGNAACASGVCDATETPATCETAGICGNGVLESSEVCDDGNAAAGGGCDATCLLELGAGPCTDGAQCASGVCNTLAAAPVCAMPETCGNGLLDVGEACDDGNPLSGDGCGESCALENVWHGGGGCAVSEDPANNGHGWILGVLIAGLLRRRRAGVR